MVGHTNMWWQNSWIELLFGTGVALRRLYIMLEGDSNPTIRASLGIHIRCYKGASNPIFRPNYVKVLLAFLGMLVH